MRSLRTPLSIAMVIGLLGGSAVSVVAQGDQPEFAAAVEVTGTSSLPSGCSVGAVSSDVETPYQERNRFTCRLISGLSWSMSDPRLEGTVLRISEANEVVGDSLDVFEAACMADDECDAPFINTQIRAFSIENDAGAWRERPRFFTSFPGSTFAVPFPDTWMTVLDGEGGYEGLVTVLQATNSDVGGQTYRGFIIDADLLPPTPENASAK